MGRDAVNISIGENLRNHVPNGVDDYLVTEVLGGDTSIKKRYLDQVNLISS